MQAQRKYESVTVEPTAAPATPRPTEIDFAPWDDAIAASPARRLHHDLVRHFERPTTPQGEYVAQTSVAMDKWSMPVRLTIIIGSSVMLWAALAGAIAAIV
ncbi:hypothetical protein [Sphingomonas sp. RS2018]